MPLSRLLPILLFLLSVLPAFAQSNPRPSIDYRLTIADPASERFEVQATLNNISADTLLFHFPIWAPGAYDLVYFGRFVDNMKATSAQGKNLKVIRRDSSTYAIHGVRPGSRIGYRVRDIETLPNSLWFCLSDIEPDLAFAVGSALFGYPAGYKDVPYRLDIDLPKGWDLAMPLEKDPARKGEFAARDYDELVDAPLQAGRLQQLEFTAGGKPHRISVWSPRKLTDSAATALVDSTRKIVEIVSGFFGEMPYDDYTFQFFLVTPRPGEAVFGALEHANSSTYRWPFYQGAPSPSLLSIIAHEYWHLWSPKRIHVAELGPFDYQRAPRTTSLWFAEGLTEYYANLLLMRNGMLPSPFDPYEELSRAVRGMYGRSQAKSLAEISQGISELDIYETMTLYSRGPIVGVLLDVAIRSQTGNTKSLDDAMRAINDEYGKSGKTFTDDEIIPLIERATGASLQEFNRRYIVGTEPLPFDEYLPAMGLKISDSAEWRSSFGAEFEVIETVGWKVTSVAPVGTLADLGIAIGDTVTALEMGGETIPTGALGRTYITLFPQLRPGMPFNVRIDGVGRRLTLGEQNAITYLHEGKIITKPLVFKQSRAPRRRMIEDPAASAQALAIRKALVGR